MSLRQLAAFQFINSFTKDSNNYFKATDFINHDKTEAALKILVELGLAESVCLNQNDLYYKIKNTNYNGKASYTNVTIDTEVMKYKKNQLTTYESLLRQVKLLQSIRTSGEEDKLIELIDKWETVTREVVMELFNHQSVSGGSLRKFVKRLGLDYEDLGFEDGDSAAEEEDHENEVDCDDESDRCYNDENIENCSFDEYKRIKYE